MANVGQAVLTVVGAVGGFIVGGPAGAAMGAQLGAAAGSALFPTELPTITGPRLSDLSTTVSTYGNPIPLLYGPQNRIAGNVVWSSGLIETETSSESGGKGGGGTQTTVSYTYAVSIATALAGRECNSLKRIWANKKLIWDVNDPPPAEGGLVFETMVFYPGDMSQMPDPTIESYLGVGEVPAYRGTCYVVITNMQLADYGNAIPSIEFEVEADESIQAGQIVRDLCQRSGVDGTATFIDDEVLGYAIGVDTTAVAAIIPLSLAYDFDMAEQYGCVRAFRRAVTAHGSIERGELGAVAHDTDEAVDSIVINDRDETDLPRSVSLQYLDPDFDLQVVAQTAQRTDGNTENSTAVEVPLVLTATQARRIAERVLWTRWSERSEAQFSVCDRYSRVSPGQVMILPDAGHLAPYRITRAQRGVNGVIEMSAVYDDAVAYTGSLGGGGVNLPENSVQYPGISSAVMLDAPLLRVEDDFPGFYWAVTSDSRGWRGANFDRSVDGGTSFTTVAPIGVRGGIADVAVALGDGVTSVFDESSTMTVQFRYLNKTIASVTELQVLNGSNVAWYGPANGQGGEIVQFQNAVLVAPGKYILSRFLRGRLGTEHAVATHGANEVFVLLDSSLIDSNFPSSDWDTVRKYRAVSVLTDPTVATVRDFTNTGERQRPRSPVHILGTRDGSNNLTITWVRRTRIPFSGLEAVAPLGETSERYEVDIIVGEVPVRTIPVTAQTASYSAANQTADGITPGSSVTLKVYQLSEVRGRGRSGNATV